MPTPDNLKTKKYVVITEEGKAIQQHKPAGESIRLEGGFVALSDQPNNMVKYKDNTLLSLPQGAYKDCLGVDIPFGSMLVTCNILAAVQQELEAKIEAIRGSYQSSLNNQISTINQVLNSLNNSDKGNSYSSTLVENAIRELPAGTYMTDLKFQVHQKQDDYYTYQYMYLFSDKLKSDQKYLVDAVYLPTKQVNTVGRVKPSVDNLVILAAPDEPGMWYYRIKPDDPAVSAQEFTIPDDLKTQPDKYIQWTGTNDLITSNLTKYSNLYKRTEGGTITGN